jgi:hypothetical protein
VPCGNSGAAHRLPCQPSCSAVGLRRGPSKLPARSQQQLPEIGFMHKRQPMQATAHQRRLRVGDRAPTQRRAGWLAARYSRPQPPTLTYAILQACQSLFHRSCNGSPQGPRHPVCPCSSCALDNGCAQAAAESSPLRRQLQRAPRSSLQARSTGDMTQPHHVSSHPPPSCSRRCRREQPQNADLRQGPALCCQVRHCAGRTG